MKKVDIVQPQPPAEEVPAEVIATAILEIAAAMKKLSDSRLKRRAIVTLLHESSKVSRRDIEFVLNDLERLAEVWLK